MTKKIYFGRSKLWLLKQSILNHTQDLPRTGTDMQEIDFHCIPRCAGPCDNINRETMNVLRNWYFLKPHDGRPIQQLCFQSKNGSRVVLKNFRVCEACFRTFIGKDFHVSDIEKKCKVVRALEEMHGMGYDVQYEAKTGQS